MTRRGIKPVVKHPVAVKTVVDDDEVRITIPDSGIPCIRISPLQGTHVMDMLRMAHEMGRRSVQDNIKRELGLPVY